MDITLPAPVSRAELRAAGWAPGELRRRERAGELRRVRRGYYLDGTDARLTDQVGRHRAAAEATLAGLAPGAAASHVTAVVLHGLPVWGVPLGAVHVTRAARTGGRRSVAVHVHTAPLPEGDVVLTAGLRVTSVARTLVDLARTAGAAQTLVAADAALRAAETTPADLAAALVRATGWQGAPAARRTLALADGRSESAGETRSRLLLVGAGLSPPQLQWPILTDRGRVRVDFAWPELRLAGEFDGLAKYGALLRPGRSASDAVVEEKLREDAIRAEGWAVVRWTWADLDDFTPVTRALHRALAGTARTQAWSARTQGRAPAQAS